MDTTDPAVCDSQSGIATDDGWTWDCDALFADQNFMCPSEICNPTVYFCSAHSDCPTSLPLCHAKGTCHSCDSCGYCSDGIDGNCGSCGDGYPTEEAGPCEPAPTSPASTTDNPPSLSPTTAVPTTGPKKVTIFERMAVRPRMSDREYVTYLIDGDTFASTWNTAIEGAGLGTDEESGYEVYLGEGGISEQNPCYYYPDELCGGSTTDTDALETHRACRNYEDEGEVISTCAATEYCPNDPGSNGIDACKVCPPSLAECDTLDYGREYCMQCGEAEVFDYPPDLNKMIRIMADDRGGASSQRVRFEGMKKRIRHALSNNKMLDDSPMFYKSQWRKMQDLTTGPDNSDYNANNFHKLGKHLDTLVSFWEEKYGNRYYSEVENASTEE